MLRPLGRLTPFIPRLLAIHLGVSLLAFSVTGAFLTPSLPLGDVPGGDLATNVAHYATFYVLTSLGWDLPRGILTAVLVWWAGPAIDRVLRRAVRRARFDSSPTFVDKDVPIPQEAA